MSEADLPLDQIICGDNCEVMRTLPDACVDSIVTDPPYGLSFMGKKWDYDVPSVACWAECLRVLKPGGHLLAFAGTRTQHRMAVRIEDAGFEIRDMIAWVYGSGFPKSLDIGKAIDRAAGAEREVVGKRLWNTSSRTPNVDIKSGTAAFIPGAGDANYPDLTAPATEAAKQWDGWGSALKPALEPITMARKPLDGTIAGNVLKHGVGGINVDGCRVEGVPPSVPQPSLGVRERVTYGFGTGCGRNGEMSQALGRFPANLIHDGSDEVVGLFPVTKSVKSARGGARNDGTTVYHKVPQNREMNYECGFNDSGSAARFFYCAKADATERRNSKHPTVKPIALMRYLVRLVTPIGAIVLDPFAGSGTTLEAAKLESCRYIGIELNPEYVADCKERLSQGVLF